MNPDSKTEVGFDLSPKAEELRAEEVRQARNLMIVMAIFLGVLVSGVLLYKHGATAESRLKIQKPKAVIKAEAHSTSETLGAIEGEDGVLWPRAQKDGFIEVRALVRAPGSSESSRVIGWIDAKDVRSEPAGFEVAYETKSKALNTLWSIAAVCLTLGLLAPAVVLPFLRVWMKVLVGPLGWFNTRLLLSLVFFLVLMPIALILRLSGRDPLDRQLEPEAESYWNDKPKLAKDHFEHSF
jgi:hypothetical protein